MKNLNSKKILLIICGGIAAYKSLEIIRLLKKSGSKVKTILTNNAKYFISSKNLYDAEYLKTSHPNPVSSVQIKYIHVLLPNVFLLLFEESLLVYS